MHLLILTSTCYTHNSTSICLYFSRHLKNFLRYTNSSTRLKPEASLAYFFVNSVTEERIACEQNATKNEAHISDMMAKLRQTLYGNKGEH